MGNRFAKRNKAAKEPEFSEAEPEIVVPDHHIRMDQQDTASDRYYGSILATIKLR